MLIGKRVRLERVSDRNTKKTIIVPLTHGARMGPIEGIRDVQNVIDVVSLAGANAIVLNKGIIHRAHRGRGRDIGLVIHLTGGGRDSHKVVVCSVEEAVRVGADAVRARLIVGGEYESLMLETLGSISKAAMDWGMPLLVTVQLLSEDEGFEEALARGARTAAELGADIISIPHPGSEEALRTILESTPAPVIIKGGEKVDRPREILQLVYSAIHAGAHGVSVGRNVFQHEKPGNMVKAISSIVHHAYTVDRAMEVLKEEALTSSVFGPPIW